jgi:hypothetical protein
MAHRTFDLPDVDGGRFGGQVVGELLQHEPHIYRDGRNVLVAAQTTRLLSGRIISCRCHRTQIRQSGDGAGRELLSQFQPGLIDGTIGFIQINR